MFTLALVICTVAVAVIAAAPTQVPIEIKESLKQSFTSIDANGNGIAEFSEFQALVRNFDTNEDGKVTIEEYAAAFQTDVATVRPIFRTFDANHNNNLDDSDIRAVLKMFDTDDNGQVTEDEFVEEYYKLVMRTLPLPPGGPQ